MRRLSLLLPLLLASCGVDRWPDWNTKTPDGYRVVLPDALGVDRSVVLVWIDVRINDWIESRKAEYGEGVGHLAWTATYFVIDDWQFPTAKGYAVGDINTSNRHPTIRCCIYDHTYGTLYPDGMGLEVIGYELDHRLGLNPEPH